MSAWQQLPASDGGGVGQPRLGVTVGLHETIVVGHDLLHDGLELAKLRGIDDGVNARLERLHRIERLRVVRNENGHRVPAPVHRLLLEKLQREIFFNGVGGEQFLKNDDLILDAAETDDEVFVIAGRVNFVANFFQRRFGGGQPFDGAEGEQGRRVTKRN